MKPLRSHTRVFSLLRRALMYTNIAPDIGSFPMTSFARMDKPSICFRMSTGARCRYTRSISRSGRSISISRCQRQQPRCRWPLAALDHQPAGMNQPTHHPRTRRGGSRRLHHTHCYELVLATPRALRLRQHPASAQCRNRVVYLAYLQTLCRAVCTQGQARRARCLCRCHRRALLLCQFLAHHAPPPCRTETVRDHGSGWKDGDACALTARRPFRSTSGRDDAALRVLRTNRYPNNSGRWHVLSGHRVCVAARPMVIRRTAYAEPLIWPWRALHTIIWGNDVT